MNNNDSLLTVADLSEYLQLSEKTILKLVKNNEVPCFKIANQWRFSRTALEEWVASQIQRMPQNDLSQLMESEYDLVPLSRLIREENIIMKLQGEDITEILNELAENAYQTQLISDRSHFFDKLIEREKLASTAIGNGIAIPHIRKPSDRIVKKPGIVLGLSPRGIDFHSPDSEATTIFFLVVSDSETVHLRILSKLSQFLRKEGVIPALKNSSNLNDLLSLFIQYNQEPRQIRKQTLDSLPDSKY